MGDLDCQRASRRSFWCRSLSRTRATWPDYCTGGTRPGWLQVWCGKCREWIELVLDWNCSRQCSSLNPGQPPSPARPTTPRSWTDRKWRHCSGGAGTLTSHRRYCRSPLASGSSTGPGRSSPNQPGSVSARGWRRPFCGKCSTVLKWWTHPHVWRHLPKPRLGRLWPPSHCRRRWHSRRDGIRLNENI